MKEKEKIIDKKNINNRDGLTRDKICGIIIEKAQKNENKN